VLIQVSDNGVFNIVRVSCMVASSTEVDVSAVVCLGYPLKVGQNIVFLVPLYLDTTFYRLKYLDLFGLLFRTVSIYLIVFGW
jgi:hypothetical protein